MELIATLVYTRSKAKRILQEIPPKSVVLLPEGLWMNPNVVDYYSRRKELFVIYNKDLIKNGRHFISMQGIDCGKLKWSVQKHYLWNDYDGYWHSGELSPIVEIRGVTTAICICYELSKIAGHGKLFNLGRIIKEAKTELLLMPADWQFNWRLPQSVLTSAFNNIPSLKVGLFSCRQELAFADTKKERRKITKKGWVSVEI